MPLNPLPTGDNTLSCDVLVVGGGINGAGIARDLAGRGAKVVLCEQHDLAQHTSSSSTKLIHGGLRYLEYYEFSLVRKALAEREVLIKAAPHIMWPLRFVMPHDPKANFLRPAWMIRAGLFLYDHLAKREVLPGSTTVDLRRHPAGQPLKPGFTKGFVYSDGWVDDARLVLLNALDAQAHGARIFTRTACIQAERGPQGWKATLRHADGTLQPVQARSLVNAAGPWTAQFLKQQANLQGTKSLRLVKGSHIVVPKMFDHDHAYIFQNPDKRIIFAIPYEGDFTLIGTTDIEHHGAIGTARIDEAEIRYLCEQASRYFARAVRPADVVWTYSGVRPLLDDESSDASAVTRDYVLELDTGAAPLLSVWGGKITTFRKLAEEAADMLQAPLGLAQGAWTAGAVMPGGDIAAWPEVALPSLSAPAAARRRAAPTPVADADAIPRFEAALGRSHAWLPAPLRARWARSYGSRVALILPPEAAALEALGAQVAPQLFEAELLYLHEHEWARSADDVLWRRTKLGLHMAEAQRAAVAAWWAARFPGENDPADQTMAGLPPSRAATARTAS
ncbi:glycerol-3-phosphate dehydrogenase [Aquincola tertiaricarbonis]|uniref:glycerol-3-phosphate dehydrogenase n=1 Tax=Aquincola tertiaricarbonis TaxID=391953 RepID=UPI000614ADA9